MKSTTQALLIAAIFAAPLASLAQTSQTLTDTPTRAGLVATGQPGSSSVNQPDAGHAFESPRAEGYGADPKATSQMGAANEATMSPYSPPIRIAR